MSRASWALVCCLVSGSAHALVGGRSEYDAHNAIVRASQATSADSFQNLVQRNTRVLGSVNAVGPGGRAMAVQAGVVVGGSAALAIGARLLPVVGAGMLAYDLYSSWRTRAVPGGALEHDPGAARVSVANWCVPATIEIIGTGPYCGSTPAEAAALLVAALNTYNMGIACGGPADGYWCVRWMVSSTVGTLSTLANSGRTRASAPWGVWVDRQTTTATASTALQCPSGTGPVGPDDRCVTGAYTVPQTAEEAAAMVFAHASAEAVDYARLMREAAGLGPVTLPADAPLTITEGTITPASATGASTVVANADGTSTTTATGWNFSRRGDKVDTITASKVVTVTVKDAQGATVGTPVVTTETAAGGVGESGEPVDPCVANPDRIGCALFGGPSSDPALGTRVVNVNVAPATGWGSDNAACPAPPSLSFMGSTFQLDLSLFCKFFEGIRFVILGIAFLVGARIVLGGFSGEKD